MSQKLTQKQRHALSEIAYCEGEYGSLHTSATLPRRRVLALVRMGLVKSVGYTAAVDDAGNLKSPGYEREGFVLTDAGNEAFEMIA